LGYAPKKIPAIELQIRIKTFYLFIILGI
jgi:hypothetical protein